MKVTPPLSASSTKTYVGAPYLRRHDAICGLPTTRYVEGMLNEHGMKNAKPVVTPALARNDGDEDEEEESTEERRILRRIVGKAQFLAPRRTDIAFATKRLARSLAKTFKIRHHCVETSLAMSVGYDGSRDEAASTKQSVHNADSVFRHRLGRRQTFAQVRVFVGNYAGWILTQRGQAQSVIAQPSCEAEFIAATSEAKNIQALFLACGQIREHLFAFRQHWCHWSGKQERFGCAILLAAS